MWMPGDPRHDPSLEPDWLSRRNDKVKAIEDYACEILDPIADKIDVVLMGNHEKNLMHRHHATPLQTISERLNLRYAGYMGFMTYWFDDGNKHAAESRGYVHHGAGAGAPMTKGMLDLTRSKIKFDFHWHMRGHIHEKTLSEQPTLTRECGVGNGRLLAIPRVMAVSGTYQRSYSDGATAYYSEEREHPPAPIGAVKIYLTLQREADIHYVLPHIQPLD